MAEFSINGHGSLEIQSPFGGFFDMEINKDGDLEFYCDNGDTYEDNSNVAVTIPKENAPDALLAIQNWIERLNAS